MNKPKYAKLPKTGKSKYPVKKYGIGGSADIKGQAGIGGTDNGDVSGDSGGGFSMGGGAMGAAMGLFNAGIGSMETNAYHKDGSINRDQYAGAESLKYGAQGAMIGENFGPEGAAIGAGVGLIGGGIYGATQADKINKANNQRLEGEAKQKQQFAAAKEAYRVNQEKQYSSAYYNVNPTYGTKGASLYALGGVTDPTTSFTGKTPQEWDTYNQKRGYVATPGITSGGGAYKGYHDPNKFGQDASGNWINKATGERTFGSFAETFNNSTTNTTSIQRSSKPFIQTTSTNPVIGFGSYGAGSFARKGTDGNPVWYDKNNNIIGQPQQTQPLIAGDVPQNAMGGYAKYSLGGNTYAPGGKLEPLSYNAYKAVGNTHDEGGIDLVNNGKPYAEVEDQEVIKGDKVYSDRIKIGNKTIAEMAEKLANTKGKFEKKLDSNDFRAKNAAKRSVPKLENELNSLFNYQENKKIASGIESPNTKYAGGGKLDNAIQYGVPYLDNVYNASLINQTPQVPLPTTKEYYAQTAVPMKTTYNINPALNDAQSNYRNFNTNIDQNTASSNDGRANKNEAFASVLKNKGQLYNTKENIETQLTNQDAQNRQEVMNSNTKNFQDIANTNLSQKDNYNMAKMNREQQILYAKSGNVSSAVGDAMKQIQDKNMAKLDEEKIMTDSLRYNNGAGFARLVGSNTMKSLIDSDPTHYKTIEKALIDSKQNDALQRFYKEYGKRS